MADWVGWLATAIAICSYFFRRPSTLRWIQAGSALCWLAYGVLIHSHPVIAANVFVAGAAAGSTFLPRLRGDQRAAGA